MDKEARYRDLLAQIRTFACADDNAIKVTKGILRETGKLIINLTDNNLYDMLEMKKNNSEPSDYLFEIIDNFLLKLEK